MPMILRQVLRLIIGLGCGLFWAMTVASVAAGARGNDHGLAMIVGSVAGVVVADRWAWLRRSRGAGAFAATLVGSVGALLVWDALPWKSPDWQGYGYWAWFLIVASCGLWWAGWGSRHAEPPAPDTSGGDGLRR